MGNGFNYVREIMQMNLPDTPVEKTVKAGMDGSTEGYSRYQFVGYMDDNEYLLSNNNRVVVRLRIGDRGQVQVRAHAGDVIMHRNRLYAWCERLESFANDKDKLLRVGMWLEFNPGPCTPYNGPTPDVSLELNNKEEKEDMATEIRYLGEAQSAMRNGLKGPSVMIKGIWERARNLDLVLSGDVLYCYVENKNEWARISTIAFTEKVQYNRIPYGFMTIKNVVFNDPATIVLWEDGTKTVVKCGEDEEFDWEKGLAMAIAKKAFGNQGNYFNQIKKWKPETEENDGLITLTLTERLNRIFGDPRIADAKKKLAAVQDLICDMTFRGATKAELVRAIKYSKDLIDFCKGVDVDIDASAERYGVIELEAKYQPK